MEASDPLAEATTTKRRARRGDGTIYETGDGRHRGSIFVPDLVTGKPARRYVTGKTAAEVRRKLEKLRVERTPKTPTLATYVERWLALVRMRVRPSTERTYRLALSAHVLPVLGAREMGRILPSDVESMTADMIARGLAPATAALARRVLAMALGDAERDGLVTRNAARLARPPRIPAGPPRALTTAEVQRLVKAAEGESIGPLALLALSTGLRRGELLALRWENVTEDELNVRATMTRRMRGGYEVGEPKTRRSRRTIALPAMARRALDRQRMASGESAWIFPNPIGDRPMSADAVGKAWRNLAARADLPGVRLHDLRHTAATLALAAGVPVRDVADSLGHASPTITLSVYGHAVPEGPRRVADAMDKALGDA